MPLADARCSEGLSNSMQPYADGLGRDCISNYFRVRVTLYKRAGKIC